MNPRDPKNVSRLRLRKLVEVSLVDQPANPAAQVGVFKLRDPQQEGQMAETQLEKALADLRAAEDRITSLTAENKRLDAVVKDKEADLRARDRDLADANLKLEREVAKHADPEEALLKGMSEPARQAFLAQKAETERLRKRLEADDAERDLARIAKGIASDFPNLPGKPEDLAPVLKAAKATMTDDQSKALDGLLKSASEAIGAVAALSKKMSGAGLAPVTTTEATVEKQARDMAVAKGITFEAAYTAILKSNPALYSAINAERGAAN